MTEKMGFLHLELYWVRKQKQQELCPWQYFKDKAGKPQKKSTEGLH